SWNPQPLVDMLARYDVTPEMLFYRFSELIPQHFGIPIHFLRYHQEGDDYKLIKHLNMNQLNVPSGLGLQEHYCRRWLSVRLLREMADRQAAGSTDRFPPPEVHISRFLDSDDRYLAFGFVRSLILSPGVNSSVTVGFRLTPDLDRTVRFVTDPTIAQVVINETCERCPLKPAECQVRAAPPVTLENEQDNLTRKKALDRVVAQIRG
ncbi:MAG: hypothetical protein WBP47_05250, partial [Candidatus Promineifilaceae bacterium]